MKALAWAPFPFLVLTPMVYFSLYVYLTFALWFTASAGHSGMFLRSFALLYLIPTLRCLLWIETTDRNRRWTCNCYCQRGMSRDSNT